MSSASRKTLIQQCADAQIFVVQQLSNCFITLSTSTSVKRSTKANTDLHDGGIILTNKTSTSDPL